MKRGAWILITVMLLASFSQVYAYENQHLFNIDIYMTIYPSGTALVKINAQLKDPFYLNYFENLSQTNPGKAEKEFHDFVYSLIYGNFKREVEKQTQEALVVVPEEGPVKLGKNWTAVVTFKIYNYLVEKNQTLQSSVYGPMQFWFKNRVFEYSWRKLTIVLPKEAYLITLAPKPKELVENVASWENGYYLPIVVITFDSSVYEAIMNKTSENTTKFIPFDEFLAKTMKSIQLYYDPLSGLVQFNATFEGVNATSYHETKIREEFNKTMDIQEINSKIEGNKVIVWGKAKPKVDYKESLTKKTWSANITLPFRFDKVSVKAPARLGIKDQKTDGKSVIIVVEQKKGICGPGFVLLILLLPLLAKRR
ncbi:CGP-CTERM sorting domain-containing protein [Thermococcus alcaliphilus]|uniref:CGP-CTERM sorting domain-containing protein n=1 Tax=Thermococcus alcaliphilus TaxID=139207 RepID=UPI00209022CB|nr:CGP-CTERM sorting domain-containing protein [Thermococcus alcaliphilus]MCO6040459.1 CGP-CTERM sorting domain-containing protein [Thermococcus alcaliphilus]